MILKIWKSLRRMADEVYHRFVQAGNVEKDLVMNSGQLWEKSARMVAGNGPPRVRAYRGSLPDGTPGYSFTTDAQPSRLRYFAEKQGTEWDEGAPGVHDVPGKAGFVYIDVEVLDG